MIDGCIHTLGALAALGDEKIAIIADYAAPYPNVGDAKAAELVARHPAGGVARESMQVHGLL